MECTNRREENPPYLPLLGREVRDLFISKMSGVLTEHAVHIFCKRDEAKAEEQAAYLENLLTEFFKIYIPLIQMANFLCDLEEDWLRDTKQVWRDFRHLIEDGLANRSGDQSDANHSPPKGASRIRTMAKEDPIGCIMDREFDKAFSRALNGESGSVFDASRFL